MPPAAALASSCRLTAVVRQLLRMSFGVFSAVFAAKMTDRQRLLLKKLEERKILNILFSTAASLLLMVKPAHSLPRLQISD